MKRKLLILALFALLLALPAAVFADGRSLGPPGGTIWANDAEYRTIGTPSSLPTNAPEHSFDTLYQFPDCEGCAPVSDAAPGYGDYNGGRWMVVKAFGIDHQLTNADDVVAMASSLEVTETTLVCPMIKK